MLKAVKRLSGSLKRRTTDEELHAIREKLASKYEERFK